MSGFGVFLAIATAFSWALGCVVHTTDSRLVGIPAVMLIRQPLASVVLGTDHRPASGAGVPIAVLMLHRPVRLHLPERIYRAARLARDVRGDVRGDPRGPLRTAGRP